MCLIQQHRKCETGKKYNIILTLKKLIRFHLIFTKNNDFFILQNNIDQGPILLLTSKGKKDKPENCSQNTALLFGYL